MAAKIPPCFVVVVVVVVFSEVHILAPSAHHTI